MRVALVALLACGRPEPEHPSPPPRHDRVELPERAIAIAAHGDLACALLSTGKVSCWGAEVQTYYRDSGDHLPVLVPGVDDAIEVSTGCARTRSGTATCWASSVFEPHPTITQVAATTRHSCVISDGGVYCAGSFGGYHFGDAPNGYVRDPKGARIDGITNATKVAVGDGEDCAIVDGGEVACWGAFWNSSPFLPVVRVPGLYDAVDVAIAGQQGCAVRKTGDVACWVATRPACC